MALSLLWGGISGPLLYHCGHRKFLQTRVSGPVQARVHVRLHSFCQAALYVLTQDSLKIQNASRLIQKVPSENFQIR